MAMSMQPCPAPDGSRLPTSHRAFFASLLHTLRDRCFRQQELQLLMPGLLAEYETLAPTDSDLSAWCDELGLWTRWHRGEAYWLTFFLQEATRHRGRVWHLLACDLYADAQTNFADDLALSALETAYDGWLRNASTLGPTFEPIAVALRWKLRDRLKGQAVWARPFDFRDGNPLADHDYTRLSWLWLTQAVDADSARANDAGFLDDIVLSAVGDDCIWHRVLADRFLGLLLMGQGRPAEALGPYRTALQEAEDHGLDTEIGHLHRLLGQALRASGHLAGACDEFKQALAFEGTEQARIYTSYWQALSAWELGDTLLEASTGKPVAPPDDRAEQALVPGDRALLECALDAYREGRQSLDIHLIAQSPYPLARVVKQQWSRSFSTNAIQVAALLMQPRELLAEVEASGPREATGLVAELSVLRQADPAAAADFRRNRARLFATLNSVPPRFEDYLANLEEHWAARRAYLEQSIALTGLTGQARFGDEIVARVCGLRLPKTLFMLFHLGPSQGMCVLLDLESGLAAPFALGFGELQLRRVHAEYQDALTMAADGVAKNRVLEGLLEHYADLLAPTLDPMLRFLPGRHLKIFPRLQMNAVPLHALPLRGKPLIEHCATVSYGQTLGLFLANQAAARTRCDKALRYIDGQAGDWYPLLLPRLREVYGEGLLEETPPTWMTLRASLSEQRARDTLFACHGRFDPADVAASALYLANMAPDGRIAFEDLFAELDLQGCRSAIMGACESGMTRTEVAAEYLGLPAAMLSAGVRYVVGALWTLPQAPTAILIEAFLEAIASDQADVCAALCQAQRALRAMCRDRLVQWVEAHIQDPTQLQLTLQAVSKLPDPPFAGPYQWAGLHVVGDV